MNTTSMINDLKTPLRLTDEGGMPNAPPSTPKAPRTARRWTWTLNNYTSEEVKDIEKNTFRYLIAGFEIGENGTKHLQGYLEVPQATTMSSLKRQPGFSRAHLEVSRGDRVSNREYCMKGEQPHAEYEELSINGPNYGKNAQIIETGSWESGGQGKRTDWHAVHEFLKTTPDFSKAREEYPEECIKYTQGIRAVINDIQREAATRAMDAEFQGIKLYPWQQRIINDIGYQPDKRRITWIVDKDGNKGKTWFAKYLLRYHGSAYLQNAKSADLAHAYKGERVVTFDYCRSNESMINYQIIEQIKNGMVFSPKYDSMTKINAIPHVICFSNFEPNRAMLSTDRWDIRHLTDADCLQESIGTGNTDTVPITEEEIAAAIDERHHASIPSHETLIDNVAGDPICETYGNCRRDQRRARHTREPWITREKREKEIDPIYNLYRLQLDNIEI